MTMMIGADKGTPAWYEFNQHTIIIIDVPSGFLELLRQ
jgi:hypothetical protein